MATSYDWIPEFNHHVSHQPPHCEHLQKHSPATENHQAGRFQAGEVRRPSVPLTDLPTEGAQGHLTRHCDQGKVKHKPYQ